MQPHAQHDGTKEKFAAYRFDQDLEAWLSGVQEAELADPEPTLFDV